MRASFSGEKYSCHEMEFNGGSFYSDCPNKTWNLNFFIELSNILMSLRLTDIFIANDCFLNMSDLSIAFVKKQLKYFLCPARWSTYGHFTRTDKYKNKQFNF